MVILISSWWFHQNQVETIALISIGWGKKGIVVNFKYSTFQFRSSVDFFMSQTSVGKTSVSLTDNVAPFVYNCTYRFDRYGWYWYDCIVHPTFLHLKLKNLAKILILFFDRWLEDCKFYLKDGTKIRI